MENLSHEEAEEIFNHIKQFLIHLKNVSELTLISLQSKDEKEQEAAFYFSCTLLKAMTDLDTTEFRNHFESFFDKYTKENIRKKNAE